MMGYARITKKNFYRRGAFSNPRLVRAERGGCWAYFQRYE